MRTPRSPKTLVAGVALLGMLAFTGCSELNQPYGGYGGYNDPYGGYGGYNSGPYGYGGYNNGPYGGYDRNWERERRREERHLDRERERLEEERRRLEQQRQQQEHHRWQPPPSQPPSLSPPVRERCPAGFSPSENKCSPEERRRGCRDMRLPGGLGCVSR